MVKSAATATKEPANCEQALARLDRPVARIAGGPLPLDRLDGYRRGAELLEDGQLQPWNGA